MTYAWYCPKCRTTAIDEQITFSYPGFSGGRRHAECGTLLEFINNGEDVLSYSPLPTSPQESGDMPLRDAEAIADAFTANEEEEIG